MRKRGREQNNMEGRRVKRKYRKKIKPTEK